MPSLDGRDAAGFYTLLPHGRRPGRRVCWVEAPQLRRRPTVHTGRPRRIRRNGSGIRAAAATDIIKRLITISPHLFALPAPTNESRCAMFPGPSVCVVKAPWHPLPNQKRPVAAAFRSTMRPKSAVRRGSARRCCPQAGMPICYLRLSTPTAPNHHLLADHVVGVPSCPCLGQLEVLIERGAHFPGSKDHFRVLAMSKPASSTPTVRAPCRMAAAAVATSGEVEYFLRRILQVRLNRDLGRLDRSPAQAPGIPSARPSASGPPSFERAWSEWRASVAAM